MTCGADKTVKLWNPYKQILLKIYTGTGWEVCLIFRQYSVAYFMCQIFNFYIILIDFNFVLIG